MQKFELVLENKKARLYDRFALFLFLLNGVAICLLLMNSNNKQFSEKIPGFIVLLLTAVVIFFYFFNKAVKTRELMSLLAAASAILYWILLGYWWIGVITLALSLLYRISKRELKIIVQPEHIIYPSFPKKIFLWVELNNVILKDGLITIDKKDNRLIQLPVDETHFTLKEKEFNDFCRQQLSSSNQ